MRMQSRIFLAAMLLASASTLAAGAPQDAKVDRLANALVQMLPMGQIFQDASAGDPNWPMQGKPDAVSVEQLACLRGELSVAGFKRIRLADARKYAAENPSRLDEDLKLLEGGAGELFGKMVKAGADEATTGSKAAPEDILKAATSEQVLSFVTFVSDPGYTDLRKLSGYGNVLDVTRSTEENEKAGTQLGASLAMQFVIKAMGTCKVPPSAYM